ncbi:unnamed protein product [Thelazia callipaeda]|uniref:Peptidase S1 domain-containing protein n=1 Tax=Thelazia callipaeda TaxID=103827 RepID=A0A0N5CP32_THECL|nr:unnamed protein product [Thelazia callipaeda]
MRFYAVFFFLLSVFTDCTFPLLRIKRDNKLSTRWISRRVIETKDVKNVSCYITLDCFELAVVSGGIDIPYTLESVITCLIPGLNEYFCFGSRANVFEPRELLLTNKKGHSFGNNNGVDVRLLDLFNVPTIEDQTNIGEKIGAIWTHDGVEFGRRHEVFKGYAQNIGGVVEYGRGVDVDIGGRADVADGAVQLQLSPLGVNVGRPGKGLANPLGYPLARSLATEQGRRWYRSQFYREGDEYKTPAERACPWCLFGA